MPVLLILWINNYKFVVLYLFGTELVNPRSLSIFPQPHAIMLRKYAANEQMVRRKAVQQQNTTQQTQAAPPSRGPFPWLRLLIAISIVLLLALLFVLSLLSTGRVAPPI